jgi:L-xylulokinase
MKNNKYMLCIDNGLSLGKAAIVDLNGNIVGVSSFKNEVIDRDRFSEVDMDLFYRKTIGAVKDLLQKADIDPAGIISVGNSGHGGGIYLVDKSGDPVRNAITSMDARGEELINNWKESGINSYPITYTNMWNGQAIPLLYWLKEHERKNYERIDQVLFCKDWIKFKLTGEFSTDHTDASNAGLMNLNKNCYDPELYRLYDIEEIYERLPAINKSQEIIGYISKKAAHDTGLKEKTPVISGLVDFVACLIGTGLYDDSAYSIVAGTWGINTAIKNVLNISPQIMATVKFPDENNFLAMDTSPNSAVNLEWFISEVLEKTCSGMDRKNFYKKIDEKIGRKEIKESDLYYFPFLYRSKLTSNMEGVIYGFNASHDIYDLVYAIYEGVVFSHLMHIKTLKSGGIVCNKAMLSGGATNSPIWCQVFADILNMEIVTTASKEVGILGLAIYQALGLGLYKNLREAVANMVTIKSVYKPDKDKNSIYMRRFKQFQKILKLLDR